MNGLFYFKKLKYNHGLVLIETIESDVERS